MKYYNDQFKFLIKFVPSLDVPLRTAFNLALENRGSGSNRYNDQGDYYTLIQAILAREDFKNLPPKEAVKLACWVRKKDDAFFETMIEEITAREDFKNLPPKEAVKLAVKTKYHILFVKAIVEREDWK